MEQATQSLIPQLKELRRLFADALPTDPAVINRYAWIIAKALNREHLTLGSVECRQLLLDYLKLPTQRPSQLHSAILSAAIKVANAYPDFRFAAFLKMWDTSNLRPEDHERRQMPAAPGVPASSGKTFPSLSERTVRALAHSLLLHPGNTAVSDDDANFLASHGYSIHQMLVTRIKEASGKDGRKYHFASLASPEGLEVECIINQLQPNPLQPLPEGKRHYVNIGQLYGCILHQKNDTVPGGSPSVQTATLPSRSSLSLMAACLSPLNPTDLFPSAIGYIEAIDSQHGHMHVYDQYSRHFVAPVQRFSRETPGTFVRFIPIIPQTSRFKTAILLANVHPASPEVQGILREIRITSINREKGFASWELHDKEHPITERLSPLQLSQGEQSPSFTSGYLTLDGTLSVSMESYRAYIYLRRGKDKLKRPHIAKLFSMEK